MLSCKDLAQKHASDHIDHQLTGSLRWSVRFHLMMCSHCRRFVRQLETVKVLINTRKEKAQEVTDQEAHELKELAGRLYETRHHHRNP